MAVRTPNNGQQRNQFQRNWGNYGDSTLVPNGSGAPLSNPEFSKLEEGDLCYVSGGAAPGVYYCTSPGTLSGGDAAWSQLAAGATVTQSVRDSAAVVVALSSAPYNNQILIDADVLDGGDGAGLAQALSDATAKVTSGFSGADVKMRAGGFVLDDAAIVAAGFSLPLVITANVRLLGSGREVSQITGGDGTGATTQEMIELNGRSELKDVKLISPVPAAAPAAGDRGVLLVTAGATPVTIRDILIDVQGAGATARTTGVAIKALGQVSDDLLVDAVDITLYDSATDARAVGVSVGELGTASQPTVQPLVRDVSVSGGQTAVEFLAVSGGRAQGITFAAALENTEGIIWDHDVNAGAGQAWNGPQIMDVHLSMGPNAANSTGTASGIRIENQTGSAVLGTQIHNVIARWPADNTTGSTIERRVLYMHCVVSGSFFIGTLLHGITSVGAGGANAPFERCLHLDAGTSNGSGFDSASISDCQSFFSGGVAVCDLDTGASSALGTIDNVRIQGNRFQASQGIGLRIDLAATNTIALVNHISSLSDTGSGTDAAHNLFV